MPVWCPIEVTDSHGRPDRLQLVLALDPEGADGPPDELVGRLSAGAGPALTVRSAATDERLVAAMARAALPGLEVSAAKVHLDVATRTEVLLDDRLVLRLYRRLTRGGHPDVELAEGVARVGGSDLLGAPSGVWRVEGHDVGALWPHPVDAVEGTDVLRRSIEDVLEARRPPSELPTDAAGPARSLGEMTARLHLALADAFGRRPLAGDALAVDLREDAAAAVPAAIDLTGLELAVGRLRHAPDLGAAIRVHGDLHPGQVHLLDGRWQVARVEGDPVHPLADRRTPTSPLRDLAGLVVAVGRLAGAALGRRDVDPGDLAARELALLAESWVERTTGALVDGYAATSGIDTLLPRSREARDGLLATFELEASLDDVVHHRGRIASGPLAAPVVTRLTPADHHRRW